LDREFLEDYEERELEEGNYFRKMASEGRFSKTDLYPPIERFHKLNYPLVWAAPGGMSIWPQIPMCGSLLIQILPVSKSNFENMHGFDVSDIDRLVDFAKDTGKVQFLVDWPTTAFYGLDFLDPIFQELRPPAVWTFPYPSELKLEVRKYREEFEALANIRFTEYVRWMLDTYEFSRRSLPIYYLAKRLMDYQRDYVQLRIMGFNEVAEYLSNLMIDDPAFAHEVFSMVACFITLPMQDSTRAERNLDIEFLTKAISRLNLIKREAEKAKFPCEIGSFLLNKLSLFPEGFESCRDLIARYTQEDLYRVMASLSEGVKRKRADVVNLKANELCAILDNIWKDADRIRDEVTAVRYGIPIGMAIIGSMAGPVGATGGLLAGLGFTVADKILDWSASSVSERIVKFFNENWLANIYDFRKKIPLR